MGEPALKSHMKGKKHIANSKPVPLFFQPKSVSVVQPVVTGIDDGPSGSTVPSITVAKSNCHWYWNELTHTKLTYIWLILA